jgi:hypothetical protein
MQTTAATVISSSIGEALLVQPSTLAPRPAS